MGRRARRGGRRSLGRSRRGRGRPGGGRAGVAPAALPGSGAAAPRIPHVTARAADGGDGEGDDQPSVSLSSIHELIARPGTTGAAASGVLGGPTRDISTASATMQPRTYLRTLAGAAALG